MRTTMPSEVAHYALAVGTVLLAWLFKIGLVSWLGTETTVIVFVVAILTSAAAWGAGPGLLATFLAVGADLAPVTDVPAIGPGGSSVSVAVRILLLLVAGVLAARLATARFARGKAARRSREKPAAPAGDLLQSVRQAAALAHNIEPTAAIQSGDNSQSPAGGLALTDQGKNDFLAVLAHELRNPLAPIRNALHMLSTYETADAHQQEARDIIERQVQQLAGIVDDLLDVFRITHRKIVLQKEVFNLADLVRLTAEDHRSGLEGRTRTLTLELPAQPVWVEGDRRRLTQVLTNLLQNAAKFTNARDEITVGVETDALRSGTTVVVRDTGIGIEPDLLPHVFDAFTQGDVGLDHKRGGLGLGLGLVKGFVELHGGKVRAASAGLGLGTEIRVWLPTARQPSKAAAAPTAPPAAPGRRRLRILIVEDNLDTAKSLQWLLTRYGHDVTMAHSGKAGVEAAKALRPDVVLCDLGLPEMDGFEVAQALRSDPATTWARLIAVSGYGQDDDRHRSEQAGFDLHLTKPIDPANLQRLLAVLQVGPQVHGGVEVVPQP